MNAINGDRLTHQNRIEPATATRTSGDGAKLMTPLAKAPAMLVKELGRERSLAHASRIGLHNAQNKARRARAKA